MTKDGYEVAESGQSARPWPILVLLDAGGGSRPESLVRALCGIWTCIARGVWWLLANRITNTACLHLAAFRSRCAFWTRHGW